MVPLTIVGRRPRTRTVVLSLVAVAMLAWSLIPLIWLLLVTILPLRDMAAVPPVLNLADIGFDKFAKVLGDEKFRNPMLNSAIVATATTLACLALGTLAAYSVARLETPGRRLFLGVLLGTQMVPGIVLIIPIFLIIRMFGLLDTVLGLILIHTAFLLPFAIWILTNFFREIPVALERAAQMDGASRVRTLVSIILPMSLPGLAATATFVFIGSWNDLFIALVLTNNTAKTAPVRIAEISQSFTQSPPDVGLIAASSMVVVLPVLIIVAVLHRYVVYGLGQGSIKG